MSGPERWLLIRGLGRRREHWHQFPDLLREKTGAQEILLLDLPGIGTEIDRWSPPTLSGIVEDLRKRWSKEEKAQWGLIGISLGGMVAMEWCRKHPEDFSHLVLINSSARKLSPIFHRMTPLGMTQIFRAVLQKDPQEREKVILNLTTRNLNDTSGLASDWAQLSQKSPKLPATLGLQLFAAGRFRLPQSLKTKILVLSSSKDQLVNPKCSTELAKHFKAMHREHPTAGHDLPLDDPLWIVNSIKEWAKL